MECSFQGIYSPLAFPGFSRAVNGDYFDLLKEDVCRLGTGPVGISIHSKMLEELKYRLDRWVLSSGYFARHGNPKYAHQAK